jgi:type II restriction/modification system DNA methylase subunit YeeA
MDRNKLKTYAPQARRDFIQAVTDRAAVFGLTPDKIEPIKEQGDVAIIAGKAFPASIVQKRKRLEERLHRHSFEHVMEAMAYTWFNRLVAIRYMEIHGYLDHGFRVLSNPDPAKTIPQIVERAEHVDLLGLDKEKVIELKLAGTKEPELYRMLLIAQCNALSKAMPFLFERIDDETEMLLPDNLLHTDSLVRKLVTEIDEEDWQHVEIIGWLYQFYISERKDEVIGKVVQSEDIPAATQLFTPNWIVKYLVQNTLGRQWLVTYPESPLNTKMKFYVQTAEQTPEVQSQLKAITPGSLNPEELTLMDPACGSGHILVEGYDLLKEIYLERGYRLRDIPKLILSKNLFGLEIDDRAAQLASFALMMKARADDRRIFDGDTQPNVLAIQESNGIDVNAIVQAFTETKITGESDITAGEFGFMGAARAPLFATDNRATATLDEKVAADLKAVFILFENAKTYGSLLTVPPNLSKRLGDLHVAVHAALSSDHLPSRHSATIANIFVTQALFLANRYKVVAANPPYLNSAAMIARLKVFLSKQYPQGRNDLFAAFVLRNCLLTSSDGFLGLMTPFVWMFLSSFADLRQFVLSDTTITSLVRPEYHAFFDSAFVPICAFILRNHVTGETGSFFDLTNFYGADLQPTKFLEALHSPTCGWRYERRSLDFQRVPNCAIAYAAPNAILQAFDGFPPASSVVTARKGMATGDNARFVRFWFEVAVDCIGFGCASRSEAKATRRRWFPYAKGGAYRRWAGNELHVVDWYDDGHVLQTLKHPTDDRIRATNTNLDYIFGSGVTWTFVTSSDNAFRFLENGMLFDAAAGYCTSRSRETDLGFLGFCNSPVATFVFKLINPTLNLPPGYVTSIPYHAEACRKATPIVQQLVAITRQDWNSHEVSWEFSRHVLLGDNLLSDCWCTYKFNSEAVVRQTAALECANNELHIQAFNVTSAFRPEAREITLYCNPRYRFGDEKDDGELWIRHKQELVCELLSYSMGCAMGRYSLDRPGLIYANSGNNGFDLSQYKTFPADKDGIIPVAERDWFSDDAAHRFEEFVAVAWRKEHLEENLKFAADSLGPRNGEQPRDTIRRYYATDFYKHHLQTYKRRPIYWLFTSGRLGAFQCLVYMHRYNEGTLARMRTEYLIPLIGKIKARIEQLKGDIEAAQSPALKKRLKKEHDLLIQHLAELAPMDRTLLDAASKKVGPTFDEKLRHYADLRIKIDLDDGVKVNYAKFADLLAEVKAVCGKAEDDE